MKTQNINFKPLIYFTIIVSNDGFTNQLMQFCGFYKLGLSLGYIYVHTPFRTFEPDFDVYTFLGFDQHFRLNPQQSQFQDIKVITIELGDELIKHNKISTFKELQSYIKKHVSGSSKEEKVLVRFRLKWRRNFFVLIHSKCPDFQDQLDFHAIYLEARDKQQRKLMFQNDKIKMLVHIRAGDAAVVETPWETFIPVKQWFQHPNRTKEYRNFKDMEVFKFKISHYADFLRKLFSYLDSTLFSVLIFSDGYQKAFNKINNKIDTFKFTTKQREFLSGEKWKAYDKKMLTSFKNIKNSRAIIGESEKNLYDFIHSAFISDIIIIGPMQRLIPKFVANFRKLSDFPIVIVLYEEKKPFYADIGLGAKEKNFIYVDIHAPDFEYIMRKLNNLKRV